VLTEPAEFSGSMADLHEAARATRLPVMRKDFIVDPYQVLETRAAGGAGVLLIVGIADDACLRDLMLAAADAGLFVLLEAFDEDDLSRAEVAANDARGEATTVLIGLNARNLATLQTERSRLRRLRERLPVHFPRVAESALTSPTHAADVARCGYHVALVGSALMRSPDPSRLLSTMIAAGRAERAVACALA
jgi:indole-3-glycerol phosphate synthase